MPRLPLLGLLALTASSCASAFHAAGGQYTNPAHRLQSFLNGDGGKGAANAALNFLSGAGLEDVMSTDNELQLAQRLIKGDKLAVLSEMVGNKDLEELWSDPPVIYAMLQSFPMFKALPGVSDILAKDQSDVTPQDGLGVLSALKQLVDTGSKNIAEMAGNHGMLSVMQDFADRAKTDPELFDLMARAEAGDEPASMELHDKVFDDVWGGVLNKEVLFGTPESEPEITTNLRTYLMDEEPELYSLITNDDPVLKQILENPTFGAKAARDISAMAAAQSA